MKNLNEIFYKEMDVLQKQIINTVPINWEQHSRGVLNIARGFEPLFKIDENNKKALRLLLLYFTGNQLFIDDLEEYSGKKGSLSKGVALIGGVGSGKSLLFKIFKEYTSKILYKNSFQLHYASEIKDTVNVNGIDHLEIFNFNSGFPITCYIDDIASGGESVKHYGTDHNVIEQLLSIRYNVYSRYGKLTHISTNKYPEELKKVYEERIVDRMKEMFNFIEVKGNSFRK